MLEHVEAETAKTQGLCYSLLLFLNFFLYTIIPVTRQSWLKVQLAGLYSTEFKRLREEFETATASAASLVSKCKDLNTVLRTEEDADRQRVLQNEINDSKCLAEGENKLVRELNIRISVLKGQLDQRLLKVDEKGSCHLLA